MTEERRWKIQELTTEGWTSIDPSTDSLIKADCAVPAGTPDEGLAQLDR